MVSLSFEPIPSDSVTNIPIDKEPITTALASNLSASTTSFAIVNAPEAKELTSPDTGLLSNESNTSWTRMCPIRT